MDPQSPEQEKGWDKEEEQEGKKAEPGAIQAG